MTSEQMNRLRWRAHVHIGTGDGKEQPPGTCYGSYETCGEHHVHDDRCGGRSLVCGVREDKDLAALLSSYDKLQAKVNAYEHLEEDWTLDRASGRTNSSALYLETRRRVEEIIRDSAHSLIAGRAGDVAGLILSQLAHKFGFSPRRVLPDAATSATPQRDAAAERGAATGGGGAGAARDAGAARGSS